MPCTFNPDVRAPGGTHRSMDNRLSPALNQDFHVITANQGGGCGHCRATQSGVAWGSSRYVLCLRCATEFFGAPDLHAVAPELFGGTAIDPDDAYVETPEVIVTKLDKDFDPAKYRHYTHESDLSDRYGCAGYRCETFAKPHRTIPANVQFMLGEGQRGHLCLACYSKLKTKYDAVPDRINCGMCGNRLLMIRSIETSRHDRVCQGCAREYYMPAPLTDGLHIDRRTAVWAMVNRTAERPAGTRAYASPEWAALHWFPGRECWFESEAEYEREMFEMDDDYRRSHISAAAHDTLFAYGTNVVKMHGFPSVTKRDSLCYGVELEMQPNASHRHMDVVNALGGKFVEGRPYIMCRDSSIGQEGVELITLPYTLDAHKSDKYMPWKTLLTELRKVAKSGMGTTACGMHVHINKRALSNLQLGKMLIVVNAPEMQELIACIAQRSDSSYAGRIFKKVTEGGKIIGDRHDALSTAKNKGTAELRIFRGNLRYERVMKNLEFADALCNYAAQQSIQKVHDPRAMLDWLEANVGFYPYLVKFLREHYQATKNHARFAAKIRAQGDWERALEHLIIEPVEGDL